MATRRTIEAPQVSQFFERRNPPPVGNVLRLEVALIAPLYQIVRAFDETGEPLSSAQLDWDNVEGTVPLYSSGYYNADPVTAPMPSLLPGAVVDAAKTNLFMTIGTGASRTTYRLYGSEDESVRFSRTDGGTLGANGSFASGSRTLSFPGVNFSLILADLTLVGSLPVNFFEDNVVYAYVTDTGTGAVYDDYPLMVLGVDPTDPQTLILNDDINIPATASGDAGVRLVLFPRMFDVITNGQSAWRPISSFVLSEDTVTGAAYTAAAAAPAVVTAYNTDPVNAWNLSMVVPAALSSPLSATVDATALSVVVSLSTDAGGLATWPIAGEAVVVTAGGETSYDHTLAQSPTPGSVQFTGTGGNTWTDDGAGVLVAAGPDAVNGTIDYETGECTINWTAAPVETVTVNYRQNENTDAQINAAIAAAYASVFRSQNVPVQLETASPEGAVVFEAAVAPTALAASTFAAVGDDGTWRIQRTERSIDGNDITVSIALAVGLNKPTSVDVVGGDTVIITLGTDGAGVRDDDKCMINGPTVPDPAKPSLRSLLRAADNLLEIVKSDGSSFSAGVEFITEAGLGDYRNHAGYRENIWGGEQTGTLENGLDSGGVEVYGGLLPVYGAEVIRARIYAEYRALRVDASPAASLEATGNRPDFIQVRKNEVEAKLGEISADNPLALAAFEYLQASEDRRCFCLSVSEVSTDTPFGTEAAVDQAVEFAKRRDVYHVAILNDAQFMVPKMTSLSVALGGTETAALVKAMRFYIPVKNFDTEPDFPIAAGGDANRNLLDPKVMSASLDFPASGVQVGDVIVFSGLESEVTADVELQNGDRGFSIVTLTKNGSPFSIETAVALPVSIADKNFTVYRLGNSLYDPVTGIYNSARAAEVLYDWHQLQSNHHPRLNKHLADEYEAEINGVFTVVDGVYLLAKFMGAVARQVDYLPVSTLPYPKSRRIRGTSDIYDTSQMNTLSGGGLILPIQQAGTGDGPIFIRRDVSSDTSTKIFQRRTAGVSEDRLAIRTERLISPRLGPNLVNDAFLDRIAIDISKLMDQYRESAEFEYVRVVSIAPITEEIRLETGIDDSGIMIIYELKHLQEAARAIVRYVVQPLD